MRLLLLAILSVKANAFVPPVNVVLNQMFDGRKAAPGIEVVFRHRVRAGEDIVDLDEKLLGTRSRTYAVWKLPDGRSVFATLEKGNYAFTGGQKFTSRSSLFNRSFLSSTAEDFREALIQEGFIRRDQLAQYKPNYNPTGDPSTWNIRENYLIHPDVFLSRFNDTVAFAVMGTNEGNKRRIVHFDRALLGVRRFEWNDANETVAWTFDQFSGGKGSASFPKRLIFHRGDTEIVASEVVSFRLLKEKQLADLIRSMRGASNGSPDEAVSTLLSYR
jgi:hypothetical protein